MTRSFHSAQERAHAWGAGLYRKSSHELEPDSEHRCRFSETEAIAILARIIMDYKIELPDEPAFSGETFEEKMERVTRSKQELTTTYAVYSARNCVRVPQPPLIAVVRCSPVKISITFVRR